MTKNTIGSSLPKKRSFSNLGAALKPLKSPSFRKLPLPERETKVHQTLLELIQKEPEPNFLLAPLLEFIVEVEKAKLVEHYPLHRFEFWLNHSSGLTFEENYRVRGKIAGKYLDRSDYQALFPIGMGKVFEGTHFVTAHKSPDLDTTVASFWGWVDAFAARVTEGLHVWNVPGGPPSQIEIDLLFRDLFGQEVFTHLAKTRTALTLTSRDLLTQKGMVTKTLSAPLSSIDHNGDRNAIVLVNPTHQYLGDWRSLDSEGVQQIILLFSSCLRWFENNLHLHLISLFAKPHVTLALFATSIQSLFSSPLKDAEPALQFSHSQKKVMDRFLTEVLEIKEGLEISFEALWIHLGKLSKVPFQGVSALKQGLQKAKLFNSKGTLVEERPPLFTYLQTTIQSLHEALLAIRKRLETLDLALGVKEKILGRLPTFISDRSEVEEIRSKMGSHLYLTVVHAEEEQLHPIGIVSAAQLQKNILGTVSLRDFCNREEMSIPSYLEVISVIDHHKSTLATTAPPFAILADAQSCNALVAKQAFLINDRYTLLGQTPKAITNALKSTPPNQFPLLQRLLQRQIASERKDPFYIHPERELIEYLHFFYAILDDTDLLSKVSAIDVEVTAELLNRMKTLVTGKETEVLSLHDLPRNTTFPAKAAQRILQNEETYSLYSKVYAHREQEIDRNLRLAAERKESNLFSDTKVQNGCCRIGQTKLFAPNFPLFKTKADAIRKQWLAEAIQYQKEKEEIDLHLHMISTIISAEEVYRGQPLTHTHQDELWLWVPPTETGLERLKRFLNAFQNSPGFKQNRPELELLGPNTEPLRLAFAESFLPIAPCITKKGPPLAILRYRAGSMNSRKALLSPFLPQL